MKYLGSKSRISKFILPLVLQNRYPHQYYVEPFAGGMNMMENVRGNRIASDKNIFLIEMWKSLTNSVVFPNEISKELYVEARTEYRNGTRENFTTAEIGWIGWMGSFNGKFYDGGYSGKTETRNYVTEQIRNTKKQIASLFGVEFQSGDYFDIIVPENSIIYCDPPYKNTTQYATSKNFDYDKFWNWVRTMTKKGHIVYVSEYSAPDDFISIWKKELINSMSLTTTTMAVENLFIHNTQDSQIKTFW